MRKVLLIIGFIYTVLIISSCGGDSNIDSGGDNTSDIVVDCSCDEIAENKGKWYKTGIYKEGERIKFGDIFTGICETKFASGEVKIHREYSNGIKHGLHATYYDNLQLKEEIKYIEGKRMHITQYHENGQVSIRANNETGVTEWFNDQGVLNFYSEHKEDILHGENYQYDDTGDILKEYNLYEQGDLLLKISKSFDDAKKYYLTVHKHGKVNKSDVEASLKKIDKLLKNKITLAGDYPEDNKILSSINLKLNKVGINGASLSVESENTLVDSNSKIQYYKINDPDGYSNLRAAPSGKILKKVYTDEIFEVVGEKDKHKKVKLSDGTIGYIHESRIVKS